MTLDISWAMGDYDIHRGLIDGQVEVSGCRTHVTTGLDSPERHWRFLRHEEFDVCELSLGSYLASFEEHRFVAVPVFPHRRFRHHYYFVNAAAGIKGPKDLEGRKVGLRTWQTTAGMWMRGILQHEYDVDLSKISWVTQSEEDIAVNPSFRLTQAPRNLEDMLLDGELAAVLYPDTLPAFKKGDPRVARLFPDAKAEEQIYFKRTGIFPIMHVLAIRKKLSDQHPWLARNLVKAWVKSRELAMKRLENPRSVSLAWLMALMEEEERLLGEDPWQIGLTDTNRKVLGTALMYALEQGILSRKVEPEELFVPSSLDELPRYLGT